MGIPDDGLDVIALPILEEVLKLWLVLKFSEHAFGAIVTFGVLELLLVKAPIALEPQGADELLLLLIFSLIVLGFHIATALAYKAGVGRRSPYVIFGACVALHILFNSLSLLDLHPGVWSIGAILISASVVASGRLVAFASRRTFGA